MGERRADTDLRGRQTVRYWRFGFGRRAFIVEKLLIIVWVTRKNIKTAKIQKTRYAYLRLCLPPTPSSATCADLSTLPQITCFRFE
jgi:hypothetical protein